MKLDVSIVSTMYHSGIYLSEFYSQVNNAVQEITSDYEIILVNDGSPDDSLEVAISLHKKDKKVRVIDLSRNFGHHKAMMTGLAHSRGELIFLIDCDLEIKPEVLTHFHNTLHQENVDVVYGVQKTRDGNLIDRVFGHLFYAVFNILSDTPLPINLTTVRLMRQRYVKALVSHQEREILIGGLWAITGFKQLAVTVEKPFKGNSTYSLGHKIAIIVDGITSFSNKPLVLIFYLGTIISSVSILATVYLVIQRIFFGVFLEGWPSLIVSVWLLGGIIISCLGVIGIYLSKIFIETKQRPYTIIRKVYEQN